MFINVFKFLPFLGISILVIQGCGSSPSTQEQDYLVVQPEPNTEDDDLLGTFSQQRDSLSEEDMLRVQFISDAFQDVQDYTVDQWVFNFLRSENLEDDLNAFERIAKVYQQYCSEFSLPQHKKIEAYRFLIFRSGSSEEDIINNLSLVIQHEKLEYLTQEELIDLAKRYTATP